MQNRSLRPGADGEAVVAGVGGDGVSEALPSTPFRPQAGEGQVVAFTNVSARTGAALTLDRAHWLWADQDCWIRYGDNAVVAAVGDFPLPSGAVAEFTPRAAAEQYIAAVRIATDGTLYVGQSEE